MIEQTKLPICKACLALSKSRDSYYKWKNKDIKNSETVLRKEIQGITFEFPRYGYRRVTKELHRRELPVNHKKVLRIMREDDLLCRRKKAFKPVTTQSNHNYRIYPNLTKDLVVTGLNQLWVADITYIYLVKDTVYLASIIDVFSRKCVGYAIRFYIDTDLTLRAFDMAITKRKHLGFSNLIHHSDRGVQYASDEYIQRLNDYGIKISMSRSGNPYDNAFMESFYKTLKVEEVYINEYETIEDAYKNIKRFIDLVYNKKRLHSSIGYIPPNEFEQEVLKTIEN